jgi:hypothetical protein
MEQPVLAFASALRHQTLRPFVSCFLAVAFFATASLAQEKGGTSAHAAGWVVISVNEYRVLRAKAYPTEPTPEPPPVDATLTRVDYDLHVLGDLATGSARLTVDVLKDGWVRVPVPAGLLVRAAQLDGKPLSLVPGDKSKAGTHLSALLSRPGRSVLTLQVEVPIASFTGEETLLLPSTDSGVTRAAVQLARQGIDLRVSGGLLADKSEDSGDTKWLAYGRGNEALSFTWRKKTEDHHVELPLRLRGSLTELASLGEDSTAISAEVSIEIVQGAARDVRIQLPDKITINQVAGAMVADWEMKNSELSVSFLEPLEHSARFVISGEARLPRDGVIDIPILRLLNTERETGGVAVEILGAGEIKDQKAQGLEDADATDLGPMIANRQSPALVAFRTRPGEAGATRTLSVNVARYDQQAVLITNIEEARYQVLLSADGKELVQARYAVRNNQRNFVKLALPAGATVWSASLAGKPVRPGQAPDGSLLLPLEKSGGGEDAPTFAVEIVYLTKTGTWQEKGHQRVTLPALDLPISRTGILLYYPPAFKVSAQAGTFRTQEYEPPTSAVLLPAIVGSGVFATSAVSGASSPAGAAKEFDRLEQFGKSGNSKEKKDDTLTLLDSFRAKSIGGKVTGILPVNVSFPAFGPSIFLVSELTSENQFPAAEFNFQRDKKGGVR